MQEDSLGIVGGLQVRVGKTRKANHLPGQSKQQRRKPKAGESSVLLGDRQAELHRAKDRGQMKCGVGTQENKSKRVL